MLSFKDKIDRIKNNQTHGSSTLLAQIINIFQSTTYSISELRTAFTELEKIDHSMVIIHHFLSKLRPAIGHDFQNHLQQYSIIWENANENVAEKLKGYLASKSLTILTHSHSGVILGVM